MRRGVVVFSTRALTRMTVNISDGAALYFSGTIISAAHRTEARSHVIEQVLNRKFLEDLTDGLRQEAAVPRKGRRYLSEIPMDSFDEADSDALQEAIAIAQKELTQLRHETPERRRGGSDMPAQEEPYIARSPELSNLQSAIESSITLRSGARLWTQRNSTAAAAPLPWEEIRNSRSFQITKKVAASSAVLSKPTYVG